MASNILPLNCRAPDIKSQAIANTFTIQDSTSSSRIVFSIEQLLEYRKNACQIEEELLDTKTLTNKPSLTSCKSSWNRKPFPKMKKVSKEIDDEMLGIAKRCLGLYDVDISDEGNFSVPEEFKDVVLVSIDFENAEGLVEQPSDTLVAQMGVCILDTQLLSTPTHKNPEEFLQTWNFSSGIGPKWRHGQYINFIFGETKYVLSRQFCEELENLIDRSRNIVLLSHDFIHERQALNAIGFDLKTDIVATVDTQVLMHQVFLSPEMRNTLLSREVFDQRLEGLLTRLGCKYKNLHVGGNDANFAMRALLLLIVRKLDNGHKLEVKETSERLTLLENIARAKLPSNPERVFSGSPQTVYRILSPFEPSPVGRLEHEYLSHSIGMANTERRDVLEATGFSDVLTPLSTWWRHQPAPSRDIPAVRRWRRKMANPLERVRKDLIGQWNTAVEVQQKFNAEQYCA